MKKTSQDRAGERQLSYCIPCHGGVHTSLCTRIPGELGKAQISGPHLQGLGSAGLRWGPGSVERPGNADTSTLEWCLEDHCIEAILGSIHFTSHTCIVGNVSYFSKSKASLTESSFCQTGKGNVFSIILEIFLPPQPQECVKAPGPHVDASSLPSLEPLFLWPSFTFV